MNSQEKQSPTPPASSGEPADGLPPPSPSKSPAAAPSDPEAPQAGRDIGRPPGSHRLRGSGRLWVEVDGEYLPVTLEQGQVRVELPFDVDFVRLAELLRQEGYFYAHHPERIDAQGWGRPIDYEGYYPFWVWREGTPGAGPTRVIFACPPEDYAFIEPPAWAEPPVPEGTASRPADQADMEAAREMLPLAAPQRPALQPVIGSATIARIRRWVPFLRQARKPHPPGR